jgi:KDO2-lipid IV(A) lauroyltransferase
VAADAVANGADVIRLIEYVAVRTVAAIVRRLSMANVRSCGTMLGRIAYLVDRRHRRIALENLGAAFPSRPFVERKALAREVFAHFGRVLLELLKFGSLSTAEMQALVEIEGEDRVWSAYDQRRGVLFFTGHFGYWEIHAIVHAVYFHAVSVLARPLDNPRLNAMLEEIRERTGNAVIYRQGAVRKILRELAANRGVALLIDQHLHTDAVTVNFFQRPAATTTALATLALRTGATVVPVFAMPLPEGRYRLIYERPVEPIAPAATDQSVPGEEPAAEMVRELTQRCSDVLEMYVRRHPELWLWVHRRWRDVGADA